MKLSEQISCPACHHQFPITAALTADIESAVKERVEHLKKSMQKTHDQERAEMKTQLEDSIRRSLESKYALSNKDLKTQLAEVAEKLSESQQNELALLKLKRDLEDQRQNQELELHRKLDSERQKIIEEANITAQEAADKALREKAYQLAQVQKALDDANRRLAQGSQQIQGEAFELEFEELLPASFPHDDFTPVPKGKTGADIIQAVKTPSGSVAGLIAHEIKHTRKWQDEWIDKLKADQRAANADLAVLITTTPPKDMKTGIDYRDGVWIVTPDLAVTLIGMLRLQLLKVHQVRTANLIPADQKEEIFRYLTGTKFKHSMEEDIDAVLEMKAELDLEKTAFNKIWKVREAKLNRLLLSKATLYGDLQGVLGRSLPVIERLELMSPVPNNDEE